MAKILNAGSERYVREYNELYLDLSWWWWQSCCPPSLHLEERPEGRLASLGLGLRPERRFA
jgi:hypothetical protein